MKESNFNTIFNNNLKLKGFSHKIADGVGGISIQNPFDGISVVDGKPWYWENKLIKGFYTSFNFRKIEDHQLVNLSKIKREWAVFI